MKRAFATAVLIVAAFWCLRCRPDSELCLTKVDLQSEERAIKECGIGQPGKTWDDCPTKDQILKDYTLEQKKCF